MATDEHLRYPDPDFERINILANPNHYWRYRMHLTLEELLQADDFNHQVSRLVKCAGR
jgi:4-alpha-glucanotransferase